MKKNAWIYGLYVFTLTSATITANAAFFPQNKKSNSDTCEGPRPSRASVRYTTPEGIGYKTGYTTLEAFFSPLTETWIPFLDLRGHVFDNGKLAANAGLGFRYLANSRVYGMNAYYDYRNTHRQHYNQVGAGLESLGRIWDFRINGYLPVGKKQSSFFHTRFFAFDKHSLLIQRKRDVSMKGANAEIGLHVDHFKNAPLYFAGGPYYLTGKNESTWGGEFRSSIDLFQRYLRLEGNVSYDHFYQWIGQGQASINIPFGKKRKVTKKANQTCSQTSTLYTRATQRVDRFEIIPVSKQKVVSRAINPTTGDPWVFWFVDNTSSSAGTCEDPFPTLLAAQNASSPNQGIYVFPGDGTARGMDQGITLQHGQLFFGAGVSHSIATTKGKVIIPALASSSPNIANSTGNVVTLANKNTVSGFNFALQNNHGLLGTGIHNLFANKNTFIASNPDIDGIHLVNPSGRVFISDSVFSGFTNEMSGNLGNGVFVELDSGSQLSSLSITRSRFMNMSCNNSNHSISIFGGNGIYVELNPGSQLANISVTNSQFTNIADPANNFGGAGVFLHVNGGACGTSIISNCNFSNIIELGQGVEFFNESGTTDHFNLLGCSFSNIDTSFGLYSQINDGVVNNCSISDCSFANLTGGSGLDAGIAFFQIGGVMDHYSVSNSTFENINDAMVGVGVFFTDGTVNNVDLLGNTFSNINLNAVGCVLETLFSAPTLSSNAVSVVNNTFAGGTSPSTGYATNIDIAMGTICLRFTGNFASPSSNPIPYLFTVSPPGTFNRTAGSDSTTNTGEFQIVGTLGSCSQ